MPHSSLSAALRPSAGRGGWLVWQRLWRWGWRLALGLLLVVWTVALGGWLTLQWVILPRLDEWRPRVEALATQALGHPVQIGSIAADGPGWVPSFTLHDVVLRDSAGREALRLPQVQAALAVPSLLALHLRFEQLLIEGAQLDVRRDAQGRWFVGGLAMGADAPALQADLSADWLFEQHEVLIRGGTLRWLDEQRGAPPLALADVQLLLRNRGRSHALRLDATPPADWGDRFAIVGQARGALLSRPGDWRRWKGTLHASLPRANVAQLRRHVDLPVDVQQGRAALRAWIELDQGLPQTATLDAVLRDVQVQLAANLAPVALAELGARFVAERQAAGGIQLAIHDLRFTTPDGAAWAPSQMAMHWRPRAAVAPTRVVSAASAASAANGAASAVATAWMPPLDGGEFTADRLDLPLLATLAERLPIGTGPRALLRQLQPEGTVQALSATWDGPLDAPRRWQARASVKGLAIAAAASPEPGGIGRPGWRGADLQIEARHDGGQASLAMVDGQLTLPGVFEEPVVPLAHFAAQLQWQVTPANTLTTNPATDADAAPAISLKVQNVRFDNADTRGGLSASWHTGAGSGFGKGGRLPGVLALEGTLSEGRASQVARYLPWGIGADTRRWVQRAVRGGELREVSYQVQGDLWDFPFVNKRDGDFRIAAKLLDATLAPVPSVPPGGPEPAWESPWPAFTQVSGDLLFERNSMRFTRTRGRLWGLALDEVQGRIPDLGDHAQVEIDGTVKGPLTDVLRLMRIAPLADASGRALDAATASGVAELKLSMALPLGHNADVQVKASVQLPGNDVRLRPDQPLLANARGKLEAGHKGLQSLALRAQVLGGEALVEAGPQSDGSLRLVVNGQASAEALRRSPELGAVAARIATRLQGQATYRLQAGWANAPGGVPSGAPTEWQLASNLQGLAIDLPAPLGKPAEQALALRLSSAPEPRAAAPATGNLPARDWLRLELGPLKGQALLESAPGGTRLLRSAWAWDAPLPEAVVGGRAVLALPRLDLDAWRPTATALSGGTADDAAWLPRALQLTTSELLLGGRRLSGVSVDLQRLAAAPGADGGEGWRAQLRADQTTGSIDYREARQAGQPGRVLARLSHLTLAAEADAEPRPGVLADPVARLLDTAGSVPALDVEVADFELRGHKLGKLVLQAVNRPANSDTAGRSEWVLTRLTLDNDDARLQADGRWEAVAGQARRRMVLGYTLEVRNGGALLERLGFGKVLRGAAGTLKGSVGWDGSPLALDLPSLGGRLVMDMKGGQFLQVDPGAARLLGVLSLQALPRRLLLDFRDVFQKGFAFDTATADLFITGGVARTENLRLRGLQALVAMAGSADIGLETQDLHVVVVPELNTGSATLAYAAVNPAVGLGAFVGQWLLREPLHRASAREFRVTGRWDDPKVDRLDRGLLDPLPASATAAPAPAPAAASSPP